MTITVVAVGRVRGALAEVVSDYEARARRYWKLEVVEVDAGGRGSKAMPERVLEEEARRILVRTPERSEVVALARSGKGMSSSSLAEYLEALAVRASPGVTFCIGGAWGLGPTVMERAARKVSLSAMTLPHEVARLVLAEQLYRAGTIRRGEPYHKGA